jgi:hypothetical protein
VLDLVLAHDHVGGRRRGGTGFARVGDVDAVAAGRLDLVLLDHDVVVAGADEDRRGRTWELRVADSGLDPVGGDADPVAVEIVANDRSSTLLLSSISTSRWSLPLSAKKTAAPL